MWSIFLSISKSRICLVIEAWLLHLLIETTEHYQWGMKRFKGHSRLRDLCVCVDDSWLPALCAILKSSQVCLNSLISHSWGLTGPQHEHSWKISSNLVYTKFKVRFPPKRVRKNKRKMWHFIDVITHAATMCGCSLTGVLLCDWLVHFQLCPSFQTSLLRIGGFVITGVSKTDTLTSLQHKDTHVIWHDIRIEQQHVLQYNHWRSHCEWVLSHILYLSGSQPEIYQITNLGLCCINPLKSCCVLSCISACLSVFLLLSQPAHPHRGL